MNRAIPPPPTHSYYIAPFWLIGSHAQSIYPYLYGRNRPPPRYRRQRIETPDGDFIDFDWLDGNPDQPIVVLLHGLEGCSRSHYALALMHYLHKLGWNGVVPHWRSCSGELNRLPRAYHSGDYLETAWILQTIRAQIGKQMLFAVGVSLGGSALLNWLGRPQSTCTVNLTAAAAVSAPIDLTAAGLAIDNGANKIYAFNFLRSMKPKVLAKARQFPRAFDIEAIKRVRSMYDFDNVITAPLHGFKNTDDYWARASSKAYLQNIVVPTLVLNAQNDPFIPAGSLPGTHEVSSAVTLEQPQHGGHAGFLSGSLLGNLNWLPNRLIQFFTSFTG